MAQPGETSPRRKGVPLWALSAAVLGVLLLAALLLPLFARVRDGGPSTCMSNMKQLVLAALMYAEDNDQRLPLASNWSDALEPYAKSRYTFECPEAHRRGPGYAYNRRLRSRAVDDIEDQEATVMLFESDLGWNAAGGRGLLPARPRHRDGDHYAFVDGHVAWVRRGEEARLGWRPKSKQ